MSRPIRIGNFSGAMGDRPDALAEIIHATPPVDVAVGDYMAEITMSLAVAAFDERRDAGRALYGPQLVPQLKPLLADIQASGIKVVTNAGIFNPESLADAVRAEVRAQGLALSVAYVRGDDLYPQVRELVAGGELTHLDTGDPFTGDPEALAAVNAYLGGWGIAAALRGGADIVITGRVADASLITGPAAWWHAWRPDELDKVAGATAAAHIIECGGQASGGNFSGFTTIEDNTVVGYPIAEVAEDGTAVITKSQGTGGAVTVDTVTAQLMYEIQGPLYRNPDVVLHVDSLQLSQQGPDRVLVSGAVGSPAPTTTKVGMHAFDGYRGVTYLFPTGLQIDQKIDVLKAQAEAAREGLDLDEVLFTVLGKPADNPTDQYQAPVAVRVAASGPSKEDIQTFGAKLPSYGLGGIPGFYVDFLMGVGSMTPQARVQYRPALVHQHLIRQEVVFDDGRIEQVALPPMQEWTGEPEQLQSTINVNVGETVEAPLGQAIYTRVGDKGGNANLGVWVPNAQAYDWLRTFLTANRIKEMLNLDPETVVERWEMPNLHGVSFVVRGYFGDNGSGNLALDQIGKATGEFLRARHVSVPIKYLLPDLSGLRGHELPD